MVTKRASGHVASLTGLLCMTGAGHGKDKGRLFGIGPAASILDGFCCEVEHELVS